MSRRLQVLTKSTIVLLLLAGLASNAWAQMTYTSNPVSNANNIGVSSNIVLDFDVCPFLHGGFSERYPIPQWISDDCALNSPIQHIFLEN